MFKLESFKLKKRKANDKLLGYVIISYEDKFDINCQVRITGNFNDIWIKMPSKTFTKNKSINLFHVKNKELSDILQDTIKKELKLKHEYLFSPEILTCNPKKDMQKARSKSRFERR